MTLSINDMQHNCALHYAERRYPDCRIFFTVMLNVIMLNVVMLSAVAPLRRLQRSSLPSVFKFVSYELIRSRPMPSFHI
jgi:hypothetical protein